MMYQFYYCHHALHIGLLQIIAIFIIHTICIGISHEEGI